MENTEGKTERTSSADWLVCHEVLTYLRQIIQFMDLYSRFLLRNHGITGPQLVILQEIAALGEITVSHLAKATSLSQGTVTNILIRLEKRGLIKRQRSTLDKRRVYVTVTEECRGLLESAPYPLQQNFIDGFGKLENWEQTMILSALQRLAKIMDPKSVGIELDKTDEADL